MRVVHVVHAFATGGLEKGIATLASGASCGVEHVVLCLTAGGASERHLPAGTNVVEMNKAPGNSLGFPVRLAGALRRLRPDVVHTRNWGGLDGVIAARLAGIRAVVHGEHGWTMDDPEGRDRRRIRIRRFLSRWVREMTCVSRRIERWLADDVRVRCPVTQIYNGVDTERFRRPTAGEGADARERLGIAPEAFVVTTCGRLDPIKNHDMLFEGFRRSRSAAPRAELLVVGDGPERGRLEQAAPQGVHLLGERFDLPRILQATDVFALTSRNEGISNTILEAMASGRPVIATDVGGNPELVEDGRTGFLVAPGDSAALADRLLRYAEDPALRARHGSAAREVVEQRYAVPAMIAAYEEVWSRVAG